MQLCGLSLIVAGSMVFRLMVLKYPLMRQFRKGPYRAGLKERDVDCHYVVLELLTAALKPNPEKTALRSAKSCPEAQRELCEFYTAGIQGSKLRCVHRAFSAMVKNKDLNTNISYVLKLD